MKSGFQKRNPVKTFPMKDGIGVFGRCRPYISSRSERQAERHGTVTCRLVVQFAAGLQDECAHGVGWDVRFQRLRSLFKITAEFSKQLVQGTQRLPQQAVGLGAVRDGDARLKMGGVAQLVDGGEQVGVQGTGFGDEGVR